MSKTSNRFPFVRSALVAALGVGFAALSSASFAATTSNLNVSANVVDSCSITTSADVSFVNYDSIASSPATTTGSVSVTCNQGAGATILLSAGDNASGGSRRMKDSGSDYLNYDLYTDATYATVWDDTTGVAWTGNGAAHTMDIYARVPAGQLSAPVGDYTDLVVASVTF